MQGGYTGTISRVVIIKCVNFKDEISLKGKDRNALDFMGFLLEFNFWFLGVEV